MSEPYGAGEFEKFLEVLKALDEAYTPVENRVMYFYQISWWRHHIKRYKQKRFYRHILTTTNDAINRPKKDKS